jgi:hypothetical protein
MYLGGDQVQRLEIEVFTALTCKTVGSFCSLDEPVSRVRDGYLHKFTQLVAVPLVTPVASGVEYIADGLVNASLIPQVSAQGVGFQALSPFKEVWKRFRDLVFSLAVVLIVISGFLIMFGVKVGDNISVTLEQMLPRLVLVMMLVALSYPLAGLIIDGMYLLMFLVLGFFAPLIPLQPEVVDHGYEIVSGRSGDLWTVLFSQNLVSFSLWEVANSVYMIVPAVIRVIIDAATSFLFSSLMFKVGAGFQVGNEMRKGGGGLRGGFTGFGKGFQEAPANWLQTLIPGAAKKEAGEAGKQIGLVAGKAADSGQPIVGIILALASILFSIVVSTIVGGGVTTVALIFLLMIVSLVIIVFRLIILLFTIYLEMIIQITFSPLLIAPSILPGNDSYLNWLKGLAINAITFPVILLLVLFSSFIGTTASDPKGAWVPPFLSAITNQKTIQIILSGLILWNMPTFVNQVRETLGYKSITGGVSITSFIAPVAGIATSAFAIAKLGTTTVERARKGGVEEVAKGFLGMGERK